jgi:hypothetical protein
MLKQLTARVYLSDIGKKLFDTFLAAEQPLPGQDLMKLIRRHTPKKEMSVNEVERILREEIEALWNEGIPVLSDKRGEYFLGNEPKMLHYMIHDLEGKILQMQNRVARMRVEYGKQLIAFKNFDDEHFEDDEFDEADEYDEADEGEI